MNQLNKSIHIHTRNHGSRIGAAAVVSYTILRQYERFTVANRFEDIPYKRDVTKGFSALELQMAWLGDAEFLRDLRLYVLALDGYANHQRVASMYTNSWMANFIETELPELTKLFPWTQFNVHSKGTAFELLYATDNEFKAYVFYYLNPKVTPDVVLEVDEYCWMKLLKTHELGEFNYMKKFDSITKKMAMKIQHCMIQEPLFDIELSGTGPINSASTFHVISGNKTASDILSSLTPRQRLAFDHKQSKTDSRKFGYLKPLMLQNISVVNRDSTSFVVTKSAKPGLKALWTAGEYDTLPDIKRSHVKSSRPKEPVKTETTTKSKLPAGKLNKLKALQALKASQAPTKPVENKEEAYEGTDPYLIGGTGFCWKAIPLTGMLTEEELECDEMTIPRLVYLLRERRQHASPAAIETMKVMLKNKPEKLAYVLAEAERGQTLIEAGQKLLDAKTKKDGIPRKFVVLWNKDEDGDFHIESVSQADVRKYKPCTYKGSTYTLLEPFLDMLENTHRKWNAGELKDEEAVQFARYKQLRALKARAIGAKTKFNDLLVGAGGNYMMNNELLKSLEFEFGDSNSRAYLEAISDHDNRVVNNYWARSQFTFVRTSKPDKRLDTTAIEKLSDINLVTNVDNLMDPTATFLMDVTTVFSVLNTNVEKTVYSYEVDQILMRQSWYEEFGMTKPKTAENVLVTFTPKLEDVRKYDMVYIIGPVLGSDKSGSIANDVGSYKHVVDGCLYSFGESTVSGKTGWYTPLMCGDQAMSIDNTMVNVVARKQFDAFQLVVVTNLIDEAIKTVESDVRQFDIPVLANGTLYQTGVPLITTERVKVNKTLLKRLINKALTGKVSSDLLTEYGMALSWYSYNKRGVEISNNKVDPYDVKTHVYIAQVLSRRQALADKVEQVVTTTGLNSMAASAMAVMIERAMQMINTEDSTLSNIIKVIMDYIKTPNIVSDVSNDLAAWDSLDYWTLQTNLVRTIGGKESCCIHHKTCSCQTTAYICLCCGANTAGPEGYCYCCEPKKECQHQCVKEHSGDKECVCCHKRSDDEVCSCCRLHIERDLDEHEVTRVMKKLSTSKAVQRQPASKDKPTKDQADKTGLSIYVNDIGIQVYKPVQPTVALSDETKEHRHVCGKCGFTYDHTHHYNYLQHPLFVGDCPHCEKNVKSTPIFDEQCPHCHTQKQQHHGEEVVDEYSKDVEEEMELPIATMSLAQITNSIPQNAAMILRGDMPENETVKFEGDDKLSVIPFVLNNHPSEPVRLGENFKVIETRDIPSDDCGFACIEYYAGVNWNERVVTQITKKTRGLNTEDLCKALNAFGYNAMVLTSAGTVSSRVNQTELFAVIIHSNTSDEFKEYQHWFVGKVSRLAYINNFKWASTMHSVKEHEQAAYSMFKTSYKNLTSLQKLQASHNLAESVQSSIPDLLNGPKVVGNCVSNGEKMTIPNGLYNFNVETKYAEMLSTALKSQETLNVSNDLIQRYDDVSADLTDLPKYLENNFRDGCLKIAQMFADPARHCRHVKVDLIKYTDKNKQITNFIDTTPLKLKNGDMLYTLTGGKYTMNFIKVKDNRIVVKVDDNRLTKMTILVPKVSFMSVMIRLYSLSKATTDAERLTQLYKNSFAVTGYGGTGKTRALQQYVQTGKLSEDLVIDTKPQVQRLAETMFVASTSGGTQSLREKLPKSAIIKSVEKATYEYVSCSTLVVDEATLLDPRELALLVGRDTNQLVVLGDPLQISNIDMMAVGGTRLTTNALATANEMTANKLKLTKSYRYGANLCDRLRKHPALADLQSAADHDTTVRMYWLDSWRISELIEIVRGSNACLVFYNEHIEMAERIKKSVAFMEVSTVHRYQGKESDVVTVIQAPSRSNATVHRQLGHCVSAATRAKVRLNWISINCMSMEAQLHERLGGLVGARFINSPNVVLPAKDSKILGDWNEVPFVSTINDAVRSDEQEWLHKVDMVAKKQINETAVMTSFNPATMLRLIKHFTPIVTKIEVETTTPVLRLRVSTLLKTAICTYDGEKLEGPIPDKYKPSVISAISWSCDLEPDCVNSDSSSLQERGRYRMRILAYITKVRQASHKKTVLRGDLKDYKLTTENRECAACAALLFTSPMGKVTKVTKDYMESTSRIIQGDEHEFIREILEKEDTWNIYNKEFDDISLSHAILVERVNIALPDAFSKHTGHTKFMYYTKYQNKLLQSRIQRDIGMVPLVTEYDNMNLYPFASKSMGMHTYSFVRDGERTKMYTVKTKFDDLILESLYTLHEVTKDKLVARGVAKLYMKNVGAIDKALPGMIKSIAWHEENNTLAGQNLKTRRDKLLIKALKYEEPMIHVPLDLFEHVTNWKLTGYSTNNRHSLGDAATYVMDIELAKLTRNTYPTARINAHLRCSYVGYLVSENINNSAAPGDSSQRTTDVLLSGTYDNMLKNHMSRTDKTNPLYDKLESELLFRSTYTGTFNDASVCIGGPHLLQTEDWLQSSAKRYDHVYFWIPLESVKVGEGHYYKMKESNIAYAVDNKIAQCISEGKDYWVDGNRYKLHTCRVTAQCRIVACSKDLSLYWSDPWFETKQMIWLKVPEIILEPTKVLQSKTILQTSVKRFPVMILANLRRRMLRPNTTFEDLIVQARTLLNTSQFTTNSVLAKYNVTVDEVYRCAKLIYRLNEYENRKLSLIASDSLTGDLKTGVLRLVSNIVGKVMPEEELKDIVKNLDEATHSQLVGMISDFFQKLDMLKPTLLRQEKTFHGSDRIVGFNMEFSVLAKVRSFFDKKTMRNRYTLNICTMCNTEGSNPYGIVLENGDEGTPFHHPECQMYSANASFVTKINDNPVFSSRPNPMYVVIRGVTAVDSLLNYPQNFTNINATSGCFVLVHKIDNALSTIIMNSTNTTFKFVTHTAMYAKPLNSGNTYVGVSEHECKQLVWHKLTHLKINLRTLSKLGYANKIKLPQANDEKFTYSEDEMDALRKDWSLPSQGGVLITKHGYVHKNTLFIWPPTHLPCIDTPLVYGWTSIGKDVPGLALENYDMQLIRYTHSKHVDNQVWKMNDIVSGDTVKTTDVNEPLTESTVVIYSNEIVTRTYLPVLQCEVCLTATMLDFVPENCLCSCGSQVALVGHSDGTNDSKILASSIVNYCVFATEDEVNTTKEQIELLTHPTHEDNYDHDESGPIETSDTTLTSEEDESGQDLEFSAAQEMGPNTSSLFWSEFYQISGVVTKTSFTFRELLSFDKQRMGKQLDYIPSDSSIINTIMPKPPALSICINQNGGKTPLNSIFGHKFRDSSLVIRDEDMSGKTLLSTYIIHNTTSYAMAIVDTSGITYNSRLDIHGNSIELWANMNMEQDDPIYIATSLFDAAVFISHRTGVSFKFIEQTMTCGHKRNIVLNTCLASSMMHCPTCGMVCYQPAIWLKRSGSEVNDRLDILSGKLKAGLLSASESSELESIYKTMDIRHLPDRDEAVKLIRECDDIMGRLVPIITIETETDFIMSKSEIKIYNPAEQIEPMPPIAISKVDHSPKEDRVDITGKVTPAESTLTRMFVPNPKSLEQLPTQFVNYVVELTREPAKSFMNILPLIPENLREGRDVLNNENWHFLSSMYTKPAKVADETIMSLGEMVRLAKVAIGDYVGPIFLTSFHEGIAARSVPTSKYMSLCFTTHPEKWAKLGWTTVKVNMEPGRLGACLRPLLATLLNHPAPVVSVGGRPRLHGLWSERVVLNLIDQHMDPMNDFEFKGNTVVSPWNIPNLYMDCFVFYKPMADNEWMDACICMSLYGNIYGSDEARFQWYEPVEYYCTKGNDRPYSNSMVHTGIKPRLDKVQWINEDANNYPDMPLKFVWRSTTTTSYNKLTYYLDNYVLPVETRNAVITVDEEFEKWFASFMESKNKPEPVSVKQKIGLNYNLHKPSIMYGKGQMGKVLYDPQVTESCVEKCIRVWANEHITDRETNELLSYNHVARYMTSKDIVHWAFIANINLRLLEDGRVTEARVSDSPWMEIAVVEQHTFKHAILAEILVSDRVTDTRVTFAAREALESLSHIEEEIVSKITAVTNNDIANNLVDNARIRYHGGKIRDVAMRAESRVEAFGCVVQASEQLATKEDWKWATLDNAQPGAWLLYRSGESWLPTICVMIEGVRYCLVTGTVSLHTMFKMSTSEDAYKIDKTFTSIKNPVSDYGFLHRSDQLWAIKHDHEHANKPVNPLAKIILARNYDARNHHNLAEYDIVMNKADGEFIILRDKQERPVVQDELDVIYASKGLKTPVRGRLMDGVVCLTSVVKDIALKKFLENVKVNSFSELEDYVMYQDECELINVGNDQTWKNQRFMEEYKLDLNNDQQQTAFKEEMTGKQILEHTGSSTEYWDATKVYDVWCYKPSWEEYTEWFEYDDNEKHFSRKDCPVIYDIKTKGFGYMDYIQGEVDTKLVDERVDDRHNIITELSTIKPSPNVSNLKPSVIAAINTLESLNEYKYVDISDEFKLEVNKDNSLSELILGVGCTSDPTHGEPCVLPAAPHVMNYWDDEMGMLGGEMELPHMNIDLQERSEFDGVKTVTKGKLTAYPTHAQPAHTKRWMAPAEATSDLFGKVLNVRLVERNPKLDAKQFAKTYFIENSLSQLSPVNLDAEAIKAWLKERPDYAKIGEDLVEVVENGLDIIGMDKVNVHLKLESRMKDAVIGLGELLNPDIKMPGTINEQRVRMIVWQRKGITTIFAAFFKQVKENLKRCLRNQFVYADGLTPQQLNMKLNQYNARDEDGEEVSFVEDDLEKQDRQTDNILIDTEMEIYKLLGANEQVVDLWRTVHKKWRAKGAGIKFKGDASRHTGQATTAIGNLIVNFLTKMDLVAKLGSKLIIMFGLGDDNIILARGKVTKVMVKSHSASHFNMISKPEISPHNGGFLRMIVFKNNVGTFSCGPDLIRLRRRFEVLNGVSEVTPENVEMRARSYAYMIGGLKPVKDLCERMNWDVQLSRWYDYQALCQNLAIKYETTTEQVEGEVAHLISMMETRQVFEDKKLIMTARGN